MTSKDMTPMVSVVLPAYKGEFFKESVKSILAQTYRDFELIVVDDASPFDFPSVLDEFNDERIVYRRNAKNIGGIDLSGAYRHACAFARGRYIVLASDDDVYKPTYLERMVELGESNPKVSLFSCRVGHIDEIGQLTDAGVPVLNHETALYFMMMHEVRRRHLTLFEWFIRRSSLEAIGGIAKYPLGWFSDTKTMYLLASYKNGGVLFAPQMLGMYRDSPIQISHPSKGVLQKCEATLQFYDWFSRLIEENGESMVTSDEDRATLCRLKAGYPLLAKALLLQLVGYARGVDDTIKIMKSISGCGYVRKRSIYFSMLRKAFRSVLKVFE